MSPGELQAPPNGRGQQSSLRAGHSDMSVLFFLPGTEITTYEKTTEKTLASYPFFAGTSQVTFARRTAEAT